MYRGVVRSLMRDAADVVASAPPGAEASELRERLELVGSYVSYTLRYCDECPWVSDAAPRGGVADRVDLPEVC